MLDFPNSPTAGQLYAAPNGVTYQWSTTYTAWLPLAVTSAGTGDFFATTTALIPTGGPTTVVFPTVVTGNSGGWYSTANGRFTPPAGRYAFFAQLTASSTTGAITTLIYLRKNGTAILSAQGSAGAANLWSMPTLFCEFDANGTDWFDIQSQNGGDRTGVTSWFGAYPISAAGPAAGTVGSWRRIARIVPVAGQTNIDFINIPADINDLELRYDLTPAANGGYIYLQMYNAAGALDNGSIYVYMTDHSNHSSAAGSNVTNYPSGGSSTAILIGGLNTASWGVSSTYSVQGRATINNIREPAHQKYVTYHYVFVDQSNTYYANEVGGAARSTNGALTGLRLYSSNNFAAGGAVSLYGSP